MALYAYSVVGATLTPVLVAAFAWKRVTPQGAVACLAGGLITIVSLATMDSMGISFAIEFSGSTFDFASSDYIVIPGVLVSVCCLIGVSLATKPSPEDVWGPFFSVKSNLD
jgi:SSS family solute:Na+ symporter/sodium/proline symporter